MIIWIVILVLAFIAILVALSWLNLEPVEKSALHDAVAENGHTLLALSAIVAVPITALIPLPDYLPRWTIPTTIMTLWGLFVAIYWDKKVVPASVLTLAPPSPLLPGVVSPPTTVPPFALDGDVVKNYRWLFTPHNGLPVEMRLELALSTERYQSARAEPRRPVGDWAHYATTDMPELDTLAASFYRLHLGRQWSTLEQASNVLNFTQACISYALDEDTTPSPEWPRYPIETLMDECGDCEDDVILAAAILKRLGFEVALLYYPGHCALGLAGADGLPGEYVMDPHTNLKYFYGETTAEGWRLGEVPEEYRGRQPEKIEQVYHVVKE